MVLVAASVVGCKDESQPDYWVEKLDDPAWRARAVKRLEQFFEDSVTKNGDLKSEGVQTLIGKTVDPLTKTYVDGYDTLDDKTRVSLIKLLAARRQEGARRVRQAPGHVERRPGPEVGRDRGRRPEAHHAFRLAFGGLLEAAREHHAGRRRHP
jgi:hypothetical protein